MAQPSISRPRLMVPGGTRPARAVSLASWPIKLVAEPKAALRPDAGLQLLGGPVMGSASGHGRRHPGNWGATAAQTSSGRYCAMSGLLNPRGSTWRRGLSCLENHPGEDALFIAIGTTGQNPSDDSVVRQHTHAQAKLSQDLRLRQFFVPCVGMTRTPAASVACPATPPVRRHRGGLRRTALSRVRAVGRLWLGLGSWRQPLVRRQPAFYEHKLGPRLTRTRVTKALSKLRTSLL